MTQITHNLMNIQQRIVTASERYQRIPDSVRLLAVSKRHSAEAVCEAYEAGQIDFGENYVSEGLGKQDEVDAMLQRRGTMEHPPVWHCIGKIQSNKARQIAQHFSWVHSVDRVKVARRLHRFRGAGSPLNVLIQVNLSGDETRAGVQPEQLSDVVSEAVTLDRLRIRGLMAMAPATDCFETQSRAFAQVKALYDRIHPELDDFDQLSMGMSGDLEAAIANGATWVRIGTDVFGKRPVD